MNEEWGITKVNCLLLTESQKRQNMTKTKQQITYLDIASLSSLIPCRFTDTSIENAMKKMWTTLIIRTYIVIQLFNYSPKARWISLHKIRDKLVSRVINAEIICLPPSQHFFAPYADAKSRNTLQAFTRRNPKQIDWILAVFNNINTKFFVRGKVDDNCHAAWVVFHK